MTPAGPQISVVVPTYNRTASIDRLLNALAAQDLPQEQFETIIVVDGDSKTIEFLENRSYPGRLRHALQATSGPGPARNLGATLASGSVLLFLDDDIEPVPTLVRTHLEAARRSDCVWLGNLVTSIPEPAGYLAMGMRLWWEEKLRNMREPGHRFDYTDLLSGHFSIPTAVFRKVGGFNPSFRCREDYEFGARLMKLGVPFQFLASARAVHHETPTLPKALGRSRAEGAADVRLARAHPDLIPSLGVSRFVRAMRKRDELVLGNAMLLDTGFAVIQALLPKLEGWGLRRFWRTHFLRLKRYAYMRGMQSECSDWSELRALLNQAQPAPEPSLTLDLAKGVPEAELELDRQAPASVRLVYAGHTVGIMPALPATESVRGRHLRPFLRQGAGFELLVGTAWRSLARPNRGEA